MSARGRSKLRHRDMSSHRYDQQRFGHRVLASRAATSAVTARATMEAPRVAARPHLRPAETRNVIRLDGDSIAYFWALETETAISYETLTLHWREFTGALTKSFTWG